MPPVKGDKKMNEAYEFYDALNARPMQKVKGEWSLGD